MNRRRFRKPAITLSLFPFLAVLVCTMGALIVLLVIVIHKARVEGIASEEESVAEQQARAEELAELSIQKEDTEWRRSELEKQRAALQQQASDQRLQLSHLEDHIRRLEERWKAARAQVTALQRLADAKSSSAEDTDSKVRELEAIVAQRRAELDEAEREAAGRERAYAIIPYDGPNGTKRRPIYIECTDQGIVLQPEGIVLSPADFEGSLGPGNPLDAALRTTREYIAR